MEAGGLAKAAAVRARGRLQGVACECKPPLPPKGETTPESTRTLRRGRPRSWRNCPRKGRPLPRNTTWGVWDTSGTLQTKPGSVSRQQVAGGAPAQGRGERQKGFSKEGPSPRVSPLLNMQTVCDFLKRALVPKANPAKDPGAQCARMTGGSRTFAQGASRPGATGSAGQHQCPQRSQGARGIEALPQLHEHSGFSSVR